MDDSKNQRFERQMAEANLSIGDLSDVYRMTKNPEDFLSFVKRQIELPSLSVKIKISEFDFKIFEEFLNQVPTGQERTVIVSGTRDEYLDLIAKCEELAIRTDAIRFNEEIKK